MKIKINDLIEQGKKSGCYYVTSNYAIRLWPKNRLRTAQSSDEANQRKKPTQTPKTIVAAHLSTNRTTTTSIIIAKTTIGNTTHTNADHRTTTYSHPLCQTHISRPPRNSGTRCCLWQSRRHCLLNRSMVVMFVLKVMSLLWWCMERRFTKSPTVIKRGEKWGV